MDPRLRRKQGQPSIVFLFLFVAMGLVLMGLGIRQWVGGNPKDATGMLLAGGMFAVIPAIAFFALRAQQEKTRAQPGVAGQPLAM